MAKYIFENVNDMNNKFARTIPGKYRAHHKHTFNLQNKAQKEKLFETIMTYGITRDHFEKRGQEFIDKFPEAYIMLLNSRRLHLTDTFKVYYFYCEELEQLDTDNSHEKYANGCFLYENKKVCGVETALRITNSNLERKKGLSTSTIKQLKESFGEIKPTLPKNILERILNAEENSEDYLEEIPFEEFYTKKTSNQENATKKTIAQNPYMRYVLKDYNKSDINKEEIANRFKTLKDFIEYCEQNPHPEFKNLIVFLKDIFLHNVKQYGITAQTLFERAQKLKLR